MVWVWCYMSEPFFTAEAFEKETYEVELDYEGPLDVSVVPVMNLLKIANARIAPLLSANKIMKEALEFYADKKSYGEQRLSGGTEEPDVEFFNDVMDDQGNEARETLAKVKKLE